jgi:hypothetical protein
MIFRQICGPRGRKNVPHSVHMVCETTDKSFCQFENNNRARRWFDYKKLEKVPRASPLCENCVEISLRFSEVPTKQNAPGVVP